jgi:hypothetical protein
MQFKNPEILYALLLLAIPIIVHLFQLRRFKKTTFTNVAFLKEISLQTRKSAVLKKWLTLITRLLLLAAIILAFTEPFLPTDANLGSNKETVIFLDNSLSMQAKGNNGTLLKDAVNQLIENLGDANFTLFTQNRVFKNTNLSAIQNELIKLGYATETVDVSSVLLKANNLFSKDTASIKNLVLISDFQIINGAISANDINANINLVQLKPSTTNNIAIDSAYISKSTPANLELSVVLKNYGEPQKDISVSLYDGDNLFSKTAVDVDKIATSVFTIPANKPFKGRLQIDDSQLIFDNELYFNINQNSKIKVLVISASEPNFLRRIYTDDEFNLTISSLKQLNYSLIDDQNLIVLNTLESLPNSLGNALKNFTDNGGSLLIMPSADSELSTYNPFLNTLNLPEFKQKFQQEKFITNIKFQHPIFENVFTDRVDNFQYPKVNSFYKLSAPALSAMDFEDGQAFLVSNKQTYLFTASIDEENSDFKNSSLIVPTLYNIGRQSLKTAALYYQIGSQNTIDVAVSLGQDDILKLDKAGESLIPQQQTYANKVSLFTKDLPNQAGIYNVTSKDKILQQVSFNLNRNESKMNYYDFSVNENLATTSISEAIDTIKSIGEVKALWKWFVIFALIMLLFEMLILKFFK